MRSQANRSGIQVTEKSGRPLPSPFALEAPKVTSPTPMRYDMKYESSDDDVSDDGVSDDIPVRQQDGSATGTPVSCGQRPEEVTERAKLTVGAPIDRDLGAQKSLAQSLSAVVPFSRESEGASSDAAVPWLVASADGLRLHHDRDSPTGCVLLPSCAMPSPPFLDRSDVVVGTLACRVVPRRGRRRRATRSPSSPPRLGESGSAPSPPRSPPRSRTPELGERRRSR